uniref:Uncharacterized protein n=1 Tax=Anopheles albimanus TaxID=7167 RepID=A0A182FT85_ANOAL
MDVENFEQVDESLEIGSLDLEQICRCCMASKRRMKPLYTMDLDEMLHVVTGIRARPDDGLPGLLCVPCVLQLRRSHYFKLQSEKTDRILRGYVSHESFLKSFEQDALPNSEDSGPKLEEPVDSAPVDTDSNNEPTSRKCDLRIELAQPVACSKCDKEFLNQRKMKRHMRIHSSERYHQCTQCEMSFADKSNLTKHMRKHTGELRNLKNKPHLCAECGKSFNISFRYKSSLRRHRRSHKDGEYNCRICAMSFRNEAKLSSHMSTRHPNVVWEHDYDVTSMVTRKSTKPGDDKTYGSDDGFERLKTNELQHQVAQDDLRNPKEESVFLETYEEVDEESQSYEDCAYTEQLPVEQVDREPLLSIQIIKTEGTGFMTE